MSPAQGKPLAFVAPTVEHHDPERARPPRAPDLRGQERRAYVRVDPSGLAVPIGARLKYGEAVTLLDLSAGGVLLETGAALRPDSDLVLELTGARDREILPVISRVLRCHVSDVRGGSMRYRGAIAFKHPLTHPLLPATPPQPLLQTAPGNFLKPEFALKTIVEGYRCRTESRTAGMWRNSAALLEALDGLRTAAERRTDATDRRVAELLGAAVTILKSNVPAESVLRTIHEELRRQIPSLTIHTGAVRLAASSQNELLTLNVWPDQAEAITAELPAGFDLDESQFRLLKTGAYLFGLAERWSPELESVAAVAASTEPDPNKLPPGWQRVVVRYLDGKLLRGFSNDFHPDRPHLHLCPTTTCSAGERLLVPIARLKAVFFVRDLEGNAQHVDSNEFDHSPRARKVEVTFRDGEVMVGSTMNYKPQGQGFFLTPASSRGNNLRVYVVTPALRHMRFL
jgi:hypothetical protein